MLALAVIAVVLVVVAAFDRRSRPPSAVTSASASASVAPTSSLSSTFFCTGANASAQGVADGTVVVANAGPRALRGTVTVMPDQGDPKAAPIEVPAAGQAQVRLADVAQAANAGALVELDGGQAAAELSISGPLGASVTHCATRASDRWHFAEGATTKDAAEYLMVFNPFPEDAIADLSFTTEDGRVVPQALTGLIVRGRSLTAVNVGDSVRRREQVAGTLVARVGRLVVSRIQTRDGSAGPKGIALTLGAPAAEPTWYFPEGLVADGLNERYQIYNPGTTEVRVQVQVLLEQGQADPIELTVAPTSRATLAANTEARIPRGVAHAAVVRATGGTVVAERTIDSGPPAPRSGLSHTLGAPAPAARWVLAVGRADQAVDEWVTVFNPSRSVATLRVTGLADGQRLPIEGLQGVPVGPGQRLAIRVGDRVQRPTLPLLVESSAAVVVERDLYSPSGTSMSMGTPLR